MRLHASKQIFHPGCLCNKQFCHFKSLNFSLLIKLLAINTKYFHGFITMQNPVHNHHFNSAVILSVAQSSGFSLLGILGRTVHTAAHIPSRIRTLDLNEKPEGTLNKDQLKQMTSRSKSMCSMPLETRLDF